jgi:hypothetical protein
MYGGRMKLEDGTLDPRIREIVIDLMDNEGFEFGEAELIMLVLKN